MKVPASVAPRFTGIDAGQAREIAKNLLDAQNRGAVGRLPTPEGVALAVRLAELVGASTSTAATPRSDELPAATSLMRTWREHDLRLHVGLEAPAAQLSLIGPALATLLSRDPTNIGFGGIVPAATAWAMGDAECAPGPHHRDRCGASLPLIIEEVRRQTTSDKQRLIEDRSTKHAAANASRASRNCAACSRRSAAAGLQPGQQPHASMRSSAADHERGLDLASPPNSPAATTPSSGITTGRTAIWADRGQRGWDMARPPRLARRWPRRVAARS